MQDVECRVGDDATQLTGVESPEVFDCISVYAGEEAIKDLRDEREVSGNSDETLIDRSSNHARFTFCGVNIGVNVVLIPLRTPLVSNSRAFGSSSPLYNLNVSS